MVGQIKEEMEGLEDKEEECMDMEDMEEDMEEDNLEDMEEASSDFNIFSISAPSLLQPLRTD